MEYTYEQLEESALKIFVSGADKPDKLIDLLTISSEMYSLDPKKARKIAAKVREIARENCRKDIRFFDPYNESLRLLARQHKDFDAYMLYVEHNREPHEMFYLPRRAHFLKLGIIQAMQRLIDDEIDILSISLPPGTGKMQPLYSKVYTPDGYKLMGDIKVGDVVYSGLNGDDTATVIGIFPQGLKDVY